MMAPLPLVIFTRVTLCESTIRHLVNVSRTVTRWNGNRTRRPINLITDDFTLAREALTSSDRHHNAEVTLAETNSGLFWPHSGVVWISADESRTHADVIRSLVHEMAHSATQGHHARAWRRTYALLLPLWWTALRPWDPYGVNLRFEIAHIVLHYAGKRLSPERQREEVATHVTAADRAYDRWEHLVIN